MATDRVDKTIRLKDGRTLSYAEFGDPGGKPLFFFHGFPNSRVGAQHAGDVAARLGIRLIAPDRPGFGLSDIKPGRRIGDWPDDVRELADALGIDRFAVMGLSGGGPYVAACALKIPERLTAVAIVSGVAPLVERKAVADMSRWNRLMVRLQRYLPWITRVNLWLMEQAVRRFPSLLMSMGDRALPPADVAVLARPEVRASVIADYTEAFRQGSRAAAQEFVLYTRPWGFRLEKITVEVLLWQGEADTFVVPSMGRYYAEVLPNCRARFYPDEGHLLSVDRMEEIQTAIFS